MALSHVRVSHICSNILLLHLWIFPSFCRSSQLFSFSAFLLAPIAQFFDRPLITPLFCSPNSVFSYHAALSVYISDVPTFSSIVFAFHSLCISKLFYPCFRLLPRPSDYHLLLSLTFYDSFSEGASNIFFWSFSFTIDFTSIWIKDFSIQGKLPGPIF